MRGINPVNPIAIIKIDQIHRIAGSPKAIPINPDLI
jgi:hypothetical protein